MDRRQTPWLWPSLVRLLASQRIPGIIIRWICLLVKMMILIQILSQHVGLFSLFRRAWTMARVLVSRRAITVRLVLGRFFFSTFFYFWYSRPRSCSSKCAQSHNTVGVDFPKFRFSPTLPWEKVFVCPNDSLPGHASYCVLSLAWGQTASGQCKSFPKNWHVRSKFEHL